MLLRNASLPGARQPARIRPEGPFTRPCVSTLPPLSGCQRSVVCKAEQRRSQYSSGLTDPLGLTAGGLTDPLDEFKGQLTPTPTPPREASNVSTEEDDASYMSAPLQKIGAMGTGRANYVALALRFPNLATENQRRRGQRGMALDFILDTASPVNVINPAIARELQLHTAGMQPSGVAAIGGIAGAPVYQLGDAQLDGVAPEQRDALVKGLQAAGLSVPSPSCAGILGRAFIDKFSAVELRLKPRSIDTLDNNSGSTNGLLPGAAASQLAAASDYPASAIKSLAGQDRTSAASSSSNDRDSGDYEVRFHSEYDVQEACTQGGLRYVPLSVLKGTGLWGAELRVQGPPGTQPLVLPALVDTGSPCTILNTAAANALGLLQVAPKPAPMPAGPARTGLFGGVRRMAGGPGSNPATPGTAANGLPTAGGVTLRRTDVNMEFSLECSLPAKAWVLVGSAKPVVGELPGFKAMGIAKGQPAAILGLDALAGSPSLILCPQQPALLVGRHRPSSRVKPRVRS